MEHNHVIVNTPTDRPNIYLELRVDPWLEKREVMGLRFLILDQLDRSRGPEQLAKSLIYFDSKATTRQALDTLRGWLCDAGLSSKESRQVVKVYYSDFEKDEKREIAEAFYKANSPCRLMLATDAMGMGVELEDLKIIVQFDCLKLLNSEMGLQTISQRMGRAARKDGEQGHFIWLVRPWFLATQRARNHQPSQPSPLQTS